MSHFELENRVHQYLAEQRQQEQERRGLLISQIYQLRGSNKLPGEYPDNFIEELRQTPLDWQIDIFEEGIRFKRDFPYESVHYGMKGWDAARVVVNLDAEKNAVAYRISLYDEQADVNVDEGVLIENGRVVSYAQNLGFAGPYRMILRQLNSEQRATKGASGNSLDHLRGEFDRLPEMVRTLSGSGYCRFLAEYVERLENGEIDVNTMPQVAIGWPLLSPYHAAPLGHNSS